MLSDASENVMTKENCFHCPQCFQLYSIITIALESFYLDVFKVVCCSYVVFGKRLRWTRALLHSLVLCSLSYKGCFFLTVCMGRISLFVFWTDLQRVMLAYIFCWVEDAVKLWSYHNCIGHTLWGCFYSNEKKSLLFVDWKRLIIFLRIYGWIEEKDRISWRKLE